MAIIMGKGCIEAIYGLMEWKGLIIISYSHCEIYIIMLPFFNSSYLCILKLIIQFRCAVIV